MNPIHVIGVDGTPWNEIALGLLRAADTVCGGRRLLERLPGDCRAERIVLDAALLADLDAVAERARRGHTVFLASGDPLYCGIGGTLRRRFAPEELVIHPAPTAFQQLFARLGQPWEEARLFSVHGSGAPLPWRRILAAPLAAVYGDHRRPARSLAAELAERFPEAAARPAAVGCDLGETGEYVKIATLGELAEDAAAARPLSVLALLPGPQRPELPLGLPDEAYRHHKNMITHPEVRAVVLAKLRLAPGVLWDIGAGSGSVGLEAAELCPGLEVHAVEKDAERFADLEANRAASGVPGHHAHCGGFLEVEPLLPSPDRIFAGGGGAELPAILRTAFSRLKPGGVLAATGVLVETVAVLSTELAEYRTELVTLNLSRALPLGSQEYFKAENPIAIAVYRKPENP